MGSRVDCRGEVQESDYSEPSTVASFLGVLVMFSLMSLCFVFLRFDLQLPTLCCVILNR